MNNVKNNPSSLTIMISRLISLGCLILLLQLSAQVYIPDPKFRTAIKEKCPDCLIGKANRYLDTSHTALKAGHPNTIKRLFLPQKKIKSLIGIEYFKGVEYLDCSENSLTSIPELGSLKNLRFFDCSYNQIPKLPDFDKNTKLESFHASNNKLMKLPQLNSTIEVLNIFQNKFEMLPDLSRYRNLRSLSVGFNNLKSIPISNSNTALEELDVDNNQLDSLPNLEDFAHLQKLSCYHNNLQKIPISFSNTKLKTLDCSYNKLTVLPELCKFEYLESIDCSYNEITIIPILPICLRYIDFRHNPVKTDLKFVRDQRPLPGFQFKGYDLY